MNNHPALDRLALPPPDPLYRLRRAESRNAGYIFTPVAFVVSVIVATLAIALVITLVASAPAMLTVPLGVTTAVSLLAWPFLGRARPWRAGAGTAAFASLALVAIVVAVIAFVAIPAGPRIVLVATGLAGLLVFRVAAMYGGWDTRAATRARVGLPIQTAPRRSGSVARGR